MNSACAEERPAGAVGHDRHFQWHNRGYADFEDFLASFSADKRKKARRERRRSPKQGIEFEFRTGATLDEDTLRRIDQLHAATYLRHGHLPYLNFEFFRRVAAALGEAFIAVLARRAKIVVATAVYFRSNIRSTGATGVPRPTCTACNFETCYHQGIE